MLRGRRKNMRIANRKALGGTGRGAADETAVVGVEDRTSNRAAARHDLRERDVIDVRGAVTDGMSGKRLSHRELIADNGLSSGVRA